MLCATVLRGSGSFPVRTFGLISSHRKLFNSLLKHSSPARPRLRPVASNAAPPITGNAIANITVVHCERLSLKSSRTQIVRTRGAGMEWACSSCTFINNAGVKVCGICSQPSSSAVVTTANNNNKWSCEVCTFVNSGGTSFCEMCENGRPVVAAPSSSTPPVSGVSSQLGSTSFRPLLRASWKTCEEDTALAAAAAAAGCKETLQLDSDSDVIVIASEAPQQFSGKANPKSRKRKAKEDDVVVLSESRSDVEISDVKEAGKKKKESVEDSNNLLKKLHQERMARTLAGVSGPGVSDSQQSKESVPVFSSLSREQMMAYIEAEGTWLEKPSSELIILTYNVWFREDLELQARMDAIGDIILQHRPHIIFFQEVTKNIYDIFRQASWWKSYNCSVNPGEEARRAYFCMQLSKLPVVSFKQTPFQNSVMGRELCLAELKAGNGEKLLVATTHLESPCPAPPTWNQMFSAERVVQAKEAMAILRDSPNVIFGGDMNWDDKQDGPPPLPSGWFDAWQQLHPGQVGFTYDSKANLMLTGSRLQKRLDRIFCKLRDFEALTIEMVGTAPIPDLTYLKEKKVKGQVQMLKLPVLPSDHFGLLLKVRPKSA